MLPNQRVAFNGWFEALPSAFSNTLDQRTNRLALVLEMRGAFFNGHKTKGICPMDKGWHDGSESGKYELLHSGQTPQLLYDWRWCAKCEQLFVPEFGRNACPKGELHDAWGTYAAPVNSGYYYIEESFSSKSPEYAEKDPNSFPKIPEWI